MSRKWPAIDIMKLFTGQESKFADDYEMNREDHGVFNAHAAHNAMRSHTKWNQWLNWCVANDNLDELMKTRYGLQVGMDDLAKAKLNHQKICEMFVRWIKSIEITAKKIIKRRNPLPNDRHNNPDSTLKTLTIKRKRDSEFEKFLRESAF